MSSKKPPSIDLRASLAVSSPAPPSSDRPAGTLDAESFLTGDTTRALPLAHLERDQAAQPRQQLDPATVDAYREVMSGPEGHPAWGPFPAVVAFGQGERFYLADGFHRVEAAQAAGLTTVRAHVRPGGLREAILHSVGANAAHGLRRTSQDKRRAVETLLRDPEWRTKSDRWIAERAAVSPDTVGRLRRESEAPLSDSDSGAPRVRVGRDGRVQNTTLIGRTPQGGVVNDSMSLSESDSDDRVKSNPASLSDPDRAPAPARPARRSQTPASFDAVVRAIQAATRDGQFSAREVRLALVALAQWGAGGEGKKARSFLRKLGVSPPRELG